MMFEEWTLSKTAKFLKFERGLSEIELKKYFKGIVELNKHVVKWGLEE